MKLKIFGGALTIVLCTLTSVQGQYECMEECFPKRVTCKAAFQGTHNYEKRSTEPCTGNGAKGTKIICCDSEKSYEDLLTKKRVEYLLGIISGAEENEYGHQVKFVGDNTGCGATIYNEFWIVTAAHCIVSNGSTVTTVEGGYIIAGKANATNPTEEDKFRFAEIIFHEDWNSLDPGNGSDIALVRLARPLPLAKGKIQPLRLESRDYKPKYGGKAILMGFGVASKYGGSPYLLEAEVPIHEPSKAARLGWDTLNPLPDTAGFTPTKAHLGVAGDDSGFTVGQGDSGGPVVCPDENGKPILCGIASFKFCELKKVCKRPSYFLRVAPFLDWIKRKTKGAEQPEDLLVDEPMLPTKVEEENIPSYLVRITGLKQSCAGTLISKHTVLTTRECISTMMGDGKPNKINTLLSVYHYATGKGYKIKESNGHNEFERDISANITENFKRPLGLNDAYYLMLREPIESAEILQLPDPGYSIDSPAVEYTMNEKAFGVETRRYLPMDRDLCQEKVNAVDSDLKLHSSHLCMRRVYSAERTCDRDIGGPLVCEGKYFCGMKTFHACGSSGFPEIFNNHLDKSMNFWLKGVASW